jgi:hypothetical protein
LFDESRLIGGLSSTQGIKTVDLPLLLSDSEEAERRGDHHQRLYFFIFCLQLIRRSIFYSSSDTVEQKFNDISNWNEIMPKRDGLE